MAMLLTSAADPPDYLIESTIWKLPPEKSRIWLTNILRFGTGWSNIGLCT